MRNFLGRLRRSGSRSLVEQLATLTSVGDGSTLSLDFTTGVLDPRLTFTRSTTGTYINSSGYVTSAAINAPRFDYDPTTGAPKGLLIEGAATNVLTGFTAGAWGRQNIDGSGTAGALANGQTGPDGVANTAARITTAAATTFPANMFVALATNAAGASRTFSVWLRGVGSNTTASIAIVGSNTPAGVASSQSGHSVTLTTSTSGNNLLALVTGLSTTAWTRVSISRTDAQATADSYRICPGNHTGTISSGLAVDVYVVQAESGIGMSSTIPTGASTATRNADNCYIYDTTSSGGLSWFKTATQGTFYVEMFKRTAGTAFGAAGFGTRANSFEDFMLYQAVGNNWLSFNWGANEYVTNYSALSSPFLIKAAVALSPSTPATEADSTVSINGSNSALNTGPNIALPFTSDLFCIGSRGPAGGTAPSQNYAETAIRRIKFFPFAMTAAQMNALTTL